MQLASLTFGCAAVEVGSAIMAYDEKLAARVRKVLADEVEHMAERKMFGGLCFMVDGGMCCGILGSDLIVRVGPERYTEALARPHTRVFDFTGRPSKGIVYVEPAGLSTAAALRKWVKQGLLFVASKAR